MHDLKIEDFISNILSRERIRLHIPQSSVAIYTEKVEATISHWENHKTHPMSLGLLKLWASAVDCDLVIKITTSEGVEHVL